MPRTSSLRIPALPCCSLPPRKGRNGQLCEVQVTGNYKLDLDRPAPVEDILILPQQMSASPISGSATATGHITRARPNPELFCSKDQGGKEKGYTY